MSKITITNFEINDWFTYMKKEPNGVDIFISDPAYEFNNKNGSGRMKFEDGADNLYKRLTYADLEACYSEMLKLSNPGAHCYIFTDRDGLFKTRPSLEAVGWQFRNVLVWDKVNLGMGYWWRNQVEYIVYCTNGKSKDFVTNAPNIFRAKKPKGISAKPSEIFESILSHQLKQDQVVCDPFAGSDPLSFSLNNNQILMQKISASYSNIYP
jgi:site-specific DNA-methyltransferase (adenine-specific)